MTANNFKLDTREDVVQFETFTNAYAKSRTPLAINHLSLPAAFDYCQRRTDGGKLFTATLDVFINFTALWCDTYASIAALSVDHGKDRSVLDTEAIFSTRMDVYRSTSAFVIRYRALWDKIMGLLIMLYAPEHYEAYVTADSRKKAFRRYSTGAGAKAEFIDQLERHLTDFDNRFRTPEVHGTGSLRKWSFMTGPLIDSPAAQILGAWNAINGSMAELGKLFGGEPEVHSATETSQPE